MSSFTQTIKFKIVIAFGACVILMVTIGLFGAFGLSKLNSNMNEAYSSNTVAISDLSDIRAALLFIRLQVRRIQIDRNPAKMAEAVEAIHSDQDRLSKAWDHYHQTEISSDKEREIAERINNGLPQFKARTDEIVAAFNAGNYDGATQLIDKIGPVADAVKDAVNQDVRLNIEQARKFAQDSESMFRTILWIAVALIGFGVMVAAGASLYLLRAISNPLKKAVDVANQIASGRLEN
ncbi:MCP four helix bundle domain-containing protein, partial [Paraburkholderia madseniana]